jgi:hypothetical protein
LEQTWRFALNLDDGCKVVLSSIPIEIGKWKEIGCLNIALLRLPPALNEAKWTIITIPNFFVESTEWLVVNDDEVYVECGITVKDRLQREIVVTAGVSPGSVSVSMPFSNNSFNPEFGSEDYMRLPIHKGVRS